MKYLKITKNNKLQLQRIVKDVILIKRRFYNLKLIHIYLLTNLLLGKFL